MLSFIIGSILHSGYLASWLIRRNVILKSCNPVYMYLHQKKSNFCRSY